MPTYEYRCTSCNADFEKFQRMSDEPVAECPECGAKAERRLSAGAGLLFKGSGFYITDYRNDSYRKAAKSDSGESTAKSGESKSSAPAAKPTAETGSGSGNKPSGGSSSAKAD